VPAMDAAGERSETSNWGSVSVDVTDATIVAYLLVVNWCGNSIRDRSRPVGIVSQFFIPSWRQAAKPMRLHFLQECGGHRIARL